MTNLGEPKSTNQMGIKMRNIAALFVILSSLTTPVFSQELKNNTWKCAWCVGVSITKIFGGNGGFSFNFPLDTTGCPDPNYTPFANRTASSTCNAVHYVTTLRSAAITGSTISMMFSITGSNPVFDACVEGQLIVDGVNQCYPNPGSPPNCRFYIEHANDTYITNPGYRWWSQTYIANGVETAAWPLQLASNVLFTVDLNDLTKWSDVNGLRADQDPDGLFNDTKAHPYAVGFTCSGIFSYGHGVRLTAGSAKFVLQSYSIN